MPKPFPKEFRRDVIAVARQGDQSIAQVARSFGVSESCLARWLKIADRDDGVTGPTSPAGVAPAGGDLDAAVRRDHPRRRALQTVQPSAGPLAAGSTAARLRRSGGRLRRSSRRRRSRR